MHLLTLGYTYLLHDRRSKYPLMYDNIPGLKPPTQSTTARYYRCPGENFSSHFRSYVALNHEARTRMSRRNLRLSTCKFASKFDKY